MCGCGYTDLWPLLGVSATVDVKKVKKVINDVLVSHYDDLTSLPKEAISILANKLYAVELINEAIKDDPSVDKCIGEFRSSLKFIRHLSQIEEHCQKLLKSFIAVRGSYVYAAIALKEDWVGALKTKLGFDLKIDIDA